MPTIQEILFELNGSRAFSKLDLRQGFFQWDLEADSKDITSFVSQVGLFRMKRLGMGVSSTPEVFPYNIQKALNGLDEVLNMAGDIVMFGKRNNEHSEYLLKVMDRLSE